MLKTNIIQYNDRAFIKIAPDLWNNLPSEIKTQTHMVDAITS